jgi:hypothetical protein
MKKKYLSVLLISLMFFVYGCSGGSSRSSSGSDMGTDTDGDGIMDNIDNCVNTANPAQEDSDNDGIGDVCEGDADSDGIIDDVDNCVNTPNPNQEDSDGDGIGDACQDDSVNEPDKTAKPVFNPANGSYSEDIEVAISCGTAGATVHYTTNGSDPTSASTVYNSPVAVSGPRTSMTIKAIAVKSEMLNSDIASAEFSIDYNYELGDTGPAGGLIFYINPDFETDGWKYLEAAPSTTQRQKSWCDFATDYIDGTEESVGDGKTNTALIVEYLNSQSEVDTAAQYCDGLTYSGYSDWFLPSNGELIWMCENLHSEGKGGFIINHRYWSSSDYGYSDPLGADAAHCLLFKTSSYGELLAEKYDNTLYVRPARSF